MAVTYISGPMTGYPDHNFPAFNEAAAQLRDCGHTVCNPAENFGGDTTLPREDYMRKDIGQLLVCDTIYMLPDWAESNGASLEYQIAKAIGLRVIGDGFTYPATLTDEPVRERDEFREELDAIFALHNAKRSDYTAGSVDLLANYRFSSGMVGLSIEQGMFMRMSEKIYRLKSLFEKGGVAEVKDESMTDTLRDIAIIAILMKLSMQGGAYGLGDSNGKERDTA